MSNYWYTILIAALYYAIVVVWRGYLRRAGPTAAGKPLDRTPVSLQSAIVIHNGLMVGLSAFMFLEGIYTAKHLGYNLYCNPVNYDRDPLALRVRR